MYSEICGSEPPDCLYDAICYDEPYANEVVKTLVFKSLFAIDRSRDITRINMVNLVRRYAKIEENSNYLLQISQMLERNGT